MGDVPTKEATPTLRVAFQGEPGAFGEEAIRRHFQDSGEVAALGFPTFADTFQAFGAGKADMAMVPVENSYAGSIHEVYDRFLEIPDALAVAEVVLTVHHCLLAPPGLELKDIRRVRSHPQALAQCAPFLRTHAMVGEPLGDTAGCARQVAEDRPAATAAIASRAAGARYGLRVLAEDIEAAKDNRTRFLLLGRTPARREGRSKTSLVMWLADRPGTLAASLDVLAKYGLNLTKIESLPSRTGPWEYVFYIDFEGHPDDPSGRLAIAELRNCSERLRLLGSYPLSLEPDPGAAGSGKMTPSPHEEDAMKGTELRPE